MNHDSPYLTFTTRDDIINQDCITYYLGEPKGGENHVVCLDSYQRNRIFDIHNHRDYGHQISEYEEVRLIQIAATESRGQWESVVEEDPDHIMPVGTTASASEIFDKTGGWWYSTTPNIIAIMPGAR